MTSVATSPRVSPKVTPLGFWKLRKISQKGELAFCQNIYFQIVWTEAELFIVVQTKNTGTWMGLWSLMKNLWPLIIYRKLVRHHLLWTVWLLWPKCSNIYIKMGNNKIIPFVSLDQTYVFFLLFVLVSLEACRLEMTKR